MINLIKYFLLPVGLLLLVVGCGTSTKRDCPAFFHPDYEKWAQQQVGETLIFVDQSGVTESFQVTAIDRNGSFQTENFGSQVSDIPCDLTVSEILIGENSNETILKRFEHGEFSDKDLPDEYFSLGIDFNTGSEEQRRYDFSIDLGERVSQVVSEIDKQINHAEMEIGGVLYQNVITEEILDTRFLTEPNQVRIVAIASGFGLVQYTRVNGAVFSRVP